MDGAFAGAVAPVLSANGTMFTADDYQRVRPVRVPAGSGEQPCPCAPAGTINPGSWVYTGPFRIRNHTDLGTEYGSLSCTYPRRK